MEIEIPANKEDFKTYEGTSGNDIFIINSGNHGYPTLSGNGGIDIYRLAEDVDARGKAPHQLPEGGGAPYVEIQLDDFIYLPKGVDPKDIVFWNSGSYSKIKAMATTTIIYDPHGLYKKLWLPSPRFALTWQEGDIFFGGTVGSLDGINYEGDPRVMSAYNQRKLDPAGYKEYQSQNTKYVADLISNRPFWSYEADRLAEIKMLGTSNILDIVSRIFQSDGTPAFIGTSSSATYAISFTNSSLDEGSSFSTSITTTNVKAGTKLYYSLSGEGINAADFLKGSLTGFGTVAANGKFSFLHTIKSDQITEGDENLEIKLFSDAALTKQVGSTATVVIKDTSLTPVISYSITPSASPINEGAILTTTVATTNVKSGTKLYYSLGGTGINASDLSKGSLTGVGSVAANGKFSFLHTIKSDQDTEGDENLEIKLFSDAARTKQVGDTASVVIKDTSTAPVLRNIGSLALRVGTKGIDRITVLGGEVVFAGAQNDILTGFSKMSNDGNWRVPSLLSGGLGNDQYFVSPGAFVVIADAGGGTDTVTAPSMDINYISFIRVNQRDIYATDGNTSVLLIDPQGLEGSANKFENFVIGRKQYSLAQLTKLAFNSYSFGGDYTYQQLQGNGSLNFQDGGLNPLSINTYISDSIYNNSIVV